MPAIGMGTRITFDHQSQSVDLSVYSQILRAFFNAGGQMIDSSPMYDYAQKLLGVLLPQVKSTKSLFVATKVWVARKQFGIDQMQESMKLWGRASMDLMQVHNLLDWQTHLPTLDQWKTEGKIRYTGVTTSHGRRYDELIDLLKNHQLDFVQLTYNMVDREAEKYLLPLVEDLGVAVIINRPFQTVVCSPEYKKIRCQAGPVKSVVKHGHSFFLSL